MFSDVLLGIFVCTGSRVLFLWIKQGKRERESDLMLSRKFRSAASNIRTYRASRASSYRPSGSDDGHDYHRDNRDGSVDDYIAFVEEWEKNRVVEEWEKNRKKKTPPQNEG